MSLSIREVFIQLFKFGMHIRGCNEGDSYPIKLEDVNRRFTDDSTYEKFINLIQRINSLDENDSSIFKSYFIMMFRDGTFIPKSETLDNYLNKLINGQPSYCLWVGSNDFICSSYYYLKTLYDYNIDIDFNNFDIIA